MGNEHKIDSSPFVTKKLGKWSSHPDMLPGQKRVFLLIGFIPLILAAIVALIILTSYRSSDFASVHDWQTFLAAAGTVWFKIKAAVIVTVCAAAVTFGFALTLNLLWMVSRTISWQEKGKYSGRDLLPFPIWMVFVFCFFWLAPLALGLFQKVLEWRLYLIYQLIANLICFLPFIALLCWTSCAQNSIECGPDEEKKHPLTKLLSVIFMFVIGAAILCIPEPGFFQKLIDVKFAWLSNCGITASAVFRYVRLLLSTVFFFIGLINILLWRLTIVIKPKKKEIKNTEAEETLDKEEENPDEIPACAQYIVDNLPYGIELEGEIEKVKLQETSEYKELSENEIDYGLEFLMTVPKPTCDQYDFFDRFVRSYDEAFKDLMESSDPKASYMKADILLQGEEGSGRTEIMLAAAMYAAIVRGQQVLYIVPGRKYAELLAERVNEHFKNYLVDSYFSADYLKKIDVESWLVEDAKKAPANILFATPETVERCFFSNASTLDEKKRNKLKKWMLSINAFFVDDFLEHSLVVRSHLVFLLDKFRLLLASEYILPQFVVAMTPVFEPEGVENIGERLFGISQFNRIANVLTLHPHPGDEYWCGNLRVCRPNSGEIGLSLEEASQALLQTSLEGKFRTLLYRKGMSEHEKNRIENNKDFKEAVHDGNLKVIAHFYELAGVSQSQDNVFYLSLACGDAAAALRLNLGDGDSAPVFFRISMEGETDPSHKENLILLPSETALPLRAYHLRSVLPFLPHLAPLKSEIWAMFGISENNPCLREIKSPADVSSGVDVQWFSDEFKDDNGWYSDDELWPFAVLATDTAANYNGEAVNFNILPNNKESIFIDKLSIGETSNRLILAKLSTDDNDSHKQYVVWYTGQGRDKLGETDLAHTDELVYESPDNCENGLGGEEYTAFGMHEAKGDDKKLYASVVEAQYRHGTDSDYLYPVRRLAWSVPSDGLEVPSVNAPDEIAAFKLESNDAVTYHIDGTIKGIMNMRSEIRRVLPSCDYSYDAYLSCFVLAPTLSSDDWPGQFAQYCSDGNWNTDKDSGFSCALTHALTASLRQRFSGWTFFTAAPVFYTEDRQGGIGQAVMWIIEPANSGRTVYSLLAKMLITDKNRKFYLDIFRTAKDILENCQTLEELRMASHMAFADEILTEDDRQKAIDIIEILISKDKQAEEAAKRLKEKQRQFKVRKALVRKLADSYTPEERKFDREVVRALMHFEERIDVTSFVVEYGWDCGKIKDLFLDVLWNNPQLFFVSKAGAVEGVKCNGESRYFIHALIYGISKDEYSKCKRELDKAVAEAMKYIDGVVDPIKKAQNLHDYIVKICEYDKEAFDNHDISPKARTVYSVLVRRKAVCEGYTMAYRYLLREAGIRSEEVYSKEMNHCWNYVQIDDNWYHVDVTHDDPIVEGKDPNTYPILHNFFLKSDEAIEAKGHKGWDVRDLPAATDTSFDNREWKVDEKINKINI